MEQKMQAKFIDQFKKHFPEFKPIDQESIGIDDDEVESEEGLRRNGLAKLWIIMIRKILSWKTRREEDEKQNLDQDSSDGLFFNRDIEKYFWIVWISRNLRETVIVAAAVTIHTIFVFSAAISVTIARVVIIHIF